MNPKDRAQKEKQGSGDVKENNNSSEHQIDPPKDSEYLKEYVKQHPDNQMAWYLLGREYMGKGQQEKAKYCFAKAGEVYKVFEQIPEVEQPISVKVIDDVKEQAAANGADEKSNQAFQMKTKSKRKSKLMSRSLVLILLLMFLLHIPIDAPDPALDELTSPQDTISEPPLQEMEEPSALPVDVPGDVSAVKSIEVFYTIKEDQEQLEQTLVQMILPSETTVDHSILVQAPTTSDNQWILWTKQPEFLLSADRDEQAGELNIDYHDAKSCVCLPADSSQAKQNYDEWHFQQEQQLVLASAMQAYQLLNNKAPTSLDAITQDYPNNILTGYTPVMEEMSILSGLAAPTQGKEKESDPNKEAEEDSVILPDSNENQEEASTSLVFLASEQLQSPLEIIVDKQNHRLALVSGQVIIRNYPVGLGGDKTPEGEFEITEKVRNPNGRSDGDFGSRGMTLSDTLYAIHGTNEPESIGKDESLGCIRMLKEDLEELFDMAPKGTKVTITQGELPEELMRSANPFSLPVLAEETNPNKLYAWLN